MKASLRYLAIILVGLVFCLGLTWIYLKSKAASQIVQKPLPTTYFATSSPVEPLIIGYGTGDSANSLATFEKLASAGQHLILWVDVQITKDRQVIASRAKEINNPKYDPQSADRSPETKLNRLSIQYVNWADAHKADESLILFEALLDRFPDRRWVVNVVDYSPGADEALSKLITSKKAAERIILQSEQDGPLSDLRKLQPMWLFGTSRAQVVQTLWLTSLTLEALAPLRGDVLITPLRASEVNQNRALATNQLVQEARRRSMKVLLGPVSAAEFDEALALKPDGVITSAVEDLMNKLKATR